ncbi:hypothetical protein ACER0A_004820 [Haloimpatiens sp. FM7315]|uniref:hypothetical protein n=1 Tax=Haloimpatiens sp. FM7315 TaxID=3298609 RepID=UPI0035A2CC4B
MFLEEVPHLKTEVELKFNSIYPVYLKLWVWATNNSNKFNDVFPYFKKWEGQEYGRIFTDDDTKEVFGTDVIKFIKDVYLYSKPEGFKVITEEVECKPVVTLAYQTVISNYYFYFIRCSNTIVLCNVEYNQRVKVYLKIEDLLGSKDTRSKNTKNDSSVQYMNGIWFTNTNRPFMAYPDGIVNNIRNVNKSGNVPFYNDFKKSYFNNYIDNRNEWYQGYKTVVSANNHNCTWEFIECVGDGVKLVVVTGFRIT